MDRVATAKRELLKSGCFDVRELDGSTPSIINPRKTDDFGFSYRAFHLYAQCGDQLQRSPGLVVQRGDAIFALGLFQRRHELSAHVVAPRGEGWVNLVQDVVEYLRHRDLVDSIYARHLTSAQCEDLCDAGFEDINCRPWIKEAPSEDETYNHRLINLGEILSLSDLQSPVKRLQGTGSKNFRSKFRLAYNRFTNFLQREEMEYQLCPMAPADYQHGREIVAQHFQHLEAGGKAIGSTALDYAQLLEHPLHDTEEYFSRIGWLIKKKTRTPVSVFLGERTGNGIGALYLTITLRDESPAKTLGVDAPRGFSAISQYAFGRVFLELAKRGWETVDMGGSETSDLNRFKRQMGGRLHETHWMVARK